MAVDFRFNVMGVDQVSRLFDRIGNGVNDFTKPYKKISTDFYKSQDTTFKNEGNFEGKQKWQKLSKAYELWKRKKYGNQPILVLTGALRKAATKRNAFGSIFDLSPKSLLMGVDIDVNGWNLAALHQFGTKKMPKREVIRISNVQKKRWVDFIRNYIHKLTKGD